MNKTTETNVRDTYRIEGVIDSLVVTSADDSPIIRLVTTPNTCLAVEGSSVLLCKQDLKQLVEIFNDIINTGE